MWSPAGVLLAVWTPKDPIWYKVHSISCKAGVEGQAVDLDPHHKAPAALLVLAHCEAGPEG